MALPFNDPRAQENLRQALAELQADYVRSIFGMGPGTGFYYSPVSASDAFKEGASYYAPTKEGKFLSALPQDLRLAYDRLPKGAELDPAMQYFTNVRKVPEGWSHQQNFTRGFSPVTDAAQQAELMARGRLYAGGFKRPEGLFTKTSYDYTKPFTLPGSDQKASLDEMSKWIYENQYGSTLPQYNASLARTQKELTGNLAARGMLGSTVNQTLADLLGAEAAQNKRTLVDYATQASDAWKRQLADQSTLMSGRVLGASDPASAAAGVWDTAAAYKAPPALAPIGDMFSTFANTYLINRMAQPYGASYGGGGYPYNSRASTGWMGSNYLSK